MERPNRYANDQFFKFASYEDTKGMSKDGNLSKDNPRFLWPDNHSRNAVTGQAIPVQRGYMRILTDAYKGYDDTLASLKTRRLHFQFNPDTLTRTVSARNDVQLWMNQDPIQFTQPIPGDANFSFDLLFNREQEVASGRYNTNNGIESANRAATLPGFTDYKQSSVTDIGVLADLQVFDLIVGQGINKDMIDALVARAKKDIEAYNAAQTKAAGQKPTGDEEDQPDTGVEISEDNIRATLNTGLGNSAFLVANPIRVVFSSLFMVEGFVTSTNVTFNKFNSAMVPTQCIINVSMQAMYLGFAKQKTFLTDYFQGVLKTEYDEDQGTSSQIGEENALIELSKNLFTKLQGPDTFDLDFNKDVGTYRYHAKRALEDPSGTTLVRLRLAPTENLKQACKDNSLQSIEATATWKAIYRGGGTGGLYTSGETVFDLTSTESKGLSLSDLKNGPDQLDFKFENPKKVVGVSDVNSGIWATNSDAIYEVQFTIKFKLTGTGGQVIDAKQYVDGKKTGKWNIEFKTDKDLSLKS
jgi:hypothetical protein